MKSLDIRVLELRHRTLDKEIHKLDRRGVHMTPNDRERAAELKKRRLVTKDQLYHLGAQVNSTLGAHSSRGTLGAGRP
jgi:hypothetical protein